MTSNEFNEKYKSYISEGFYGLSFDIPKVTDYLDEIMDDLITIPGFTLLQIKLKFDNARFYFQTKWKQKDFEYSLERNIEAKINELVKEHYEKK